MAQAVTTATTETAGPDATLIVTCDRLIEANTTFVATADPDNATLTAPMQDAIDALMVEIKATPASSHAGLRAKARAAWSMLISAGIEEAQPDGIHDDLAVSMIREMIAGAEVAHLRRNAASVARSAMRPDIWAAPARGAFCVPLLDQIKAPFDRPRPLGQPLRTFPSH
jgi:hypothetical protein